MLIGAQPLFVALLAVRFAPDQKPHGWRGTAGVVLGFAGVVMLFGVDLRGGHRALLGGGLVLVAALCYAAGALMIHRRHADAQPLGVATSAMLVSGGVLVVPAVATLPSHMPNPAAAVALIVLGIGCTGATLVLFYTLIVRSGPALAALAFYLSPAFAVGIGAVLLSEDLSVSAVAGLVAIIVGSVLAGQRSEPTYGAARPGIAPSHGPAQ